METPTGLETPLGQMLVRMSPENLKDQIFKAQFNLDKLKALPQLILVANYGKKKAKIIMGQEEALKNAREIAKQNPTPENLMRITNIEVGKKHWSDPSNYKSSRSQKTLPIMRMN